MDNLDKLLTEISLPTSKIKTKSLQVILKCAQKTESHETWAQILQKLWEHLMMTFDSFDDQLLCGTCFFTILPLLPTEKKILKLKEVQSIIENEIKLKKKESGIENSKLTQAVSLMYGMLQSSFLNSEALVLCETSINKHYWSDYLQPTVNDAFDLLLILAYEYSPYTFIVFKTLSLFKKVYFTKVVEYEDWIHVIETTFLSYEAIEGQVCKLFKLVSFNWENPITGVRDLNKNIFGYLISLIYKTDITDISTSDFCVDSLLNDNTWNKAKYLMLAEIMEVISPIAPKTMAWDEHRSGGIHWHENKGVQTMWIEGLMFSLKSPGLVSSGADMYYAMLKKIDSKDNWIKIFLPAVINILKGKSTKAIENLRNYWLLNTLKKFPSLLGDILEELEKHEDVEHQLFSVICLLQQGNKLQLLTKYCKKCNCKCFVFPFQKYQKYVLDGLDNADENTRMLSFNIICNFNGETMQSQFKYQLVLNYLKNNVNSSCTVLRIDMLSSYKDFLIDLHLTYLKQDTVKIDNANIIDICLKFQQFFYMSLNINGNYQRRITTIKLCDVFWSILNEVPKNAKKQMRKYKIALKFILAADDNLWILSEEPFVIKLLDFLKDPSDDVRETTMNLLSNYYCDDLMKKKHNDTILTDAKSLIESKHFYQINCGLSHFKLCVELLTTGNFSTAEYQTVETLFDFVYSQIIEEYKMKRNIVETIESGKQMHSFISILHTILKVCNEHNYSICLDSNKMWILLSVLEGVMHQFSYDQEASTSSDFSRINEMVNTIIEQSGRSYSDKDETKISGMHQLVLNCLWLNVKSSCELASLILRNYKEDRYVNISKKCLEIITHVLETSRHKGAIEAAGTCLGQCIKYLTSSVPKDSVLADLPRDLLKEKLEDLYNKLASTTRRGAGLSIMVHRIVASDLSRNKPLFHFFMKSILEKCSVMKDPNSMCEDDDNARDVPKAVYIHYLTRIVTDSSLATHTMFYCAKLGEIAFTNLTSTHWQIRNAALQLYGALVGKLIGQKKSSGTEDETLATVAWEEFHTHSPELWDLMVSQIRSSQSQEDKMLAHSQLVPILNCLASLAKRYYVFDTKFIINDAEYDIDLLKSFLLLLGSPIYTVRRLTAKSIFNVFPCEKVLNELMKMNHGSENFLHGCLMLISLYDAIKDCGQRSCWEVILPNVYSEYKDKIKEIIGHGKHSYITLTLYNEIYERYVNDDYSNTYVTEIIQKVCNVDNCQPGLHVWAQKEMKNIISNGCSSYFIYGLEQLINFEIDIEKYLEIVDKHFDENILKLQEANLKQIAKKLFSFDDCIKFRSFFIWKILDQINNRTAITEQINVQSIYEYILKHKVFRDEIGKLEPMPDPELNPYKLRYMLPLLAKFVNVSTESNQLFLSNIILSYSLPDNVTNEEMRYIAALANNELARNLNNLPTKAKINVILAAVILLQDEDEDVRNSSIQFYSNATNNKSMHSFICLNKLMDVQFLQDILNTNIFIFCNELSKLVDSLTNCNKDINNPFSNDVKNIYMETDFVKCLIEKINTV